MKSVATHLANGRSLVNSVWTVRDPCRSCAVILPTCAHAQTHAHRHRHVLLHTQQTHKQRRAKARTVTHARTHSHILRHNPTYSHALLSKIAGISTRTSTLARSSTHTHTHTHIPQWRYALAIHLLTTGLLGSVVVFARQEISQLCKEL